MRASLEDFCLAELRIKPRDSACCMKIDKSMDLYPMGHEGKSRGLLPNLTLWITRDAYCMKVGKSRDFCPTGHEGESWELLPNLNLQKVKGVGFCTKVGKSRDLCLMDYRANPGDFCLG